MINGGYVRRTDFIGCCIITEKGIKAVENNDYIRSGPKGKLTGVRKSSTGTLSSSIWAALRARNISTTEELMSLIPIKKEDYDRAYDSTRRRLYWLYKSGIVRRLLRKQQGLHLTSPGFNRYQLMIDLGPKHPVIRVLKHQLYDQNTQINVPFKEVLTVFKDRIK